MGHGNGVNESYLGPTNSLKKLAKSVVNLPSIPVLKTSLIKCNIDLLILVEWRKEISCLINISLKTNAQKNQ